MYEIDEKRVCKWKNGVHTVLYIDVVPMHNAAKTKHFVQFGSPCFLHYYNVTKCVRTQPRMVAALKYTPQLS